MLFICNFKQLHVIFSITLSNMQSTVAIISSSFTIIKAIEGGKSMTLVMS